MFNEVLDIFGKPGRRFYEFLGMVAEDQKEKTHLRHLLTKDGQADFKALVEDTVTYADLMEMFPSCKVNMESVLDFIPNIKPRLYSIASA